MTLMNSYKHFFLLITIFLSVSGMAQTELEKKLFELPDVIFNKIDTPDGYQSAYKLMVKQPLDHNNPDAGYFYQRVWLSHKGYSNTTTIITNGYARGYNNINEIVKLLDANQLNVEHRYFGESMPDSLDYQYLNFEQVARDYHHIRQLFDNIYNGKWASSGISKGGTTTIFYKYFYPNDVDVSIPYVAPLNYEYEEQRIYDFLDKKGTPECRANMLAYQKRLLQQRESILPLLEWFVKGKGLKFNYLSLGEAYEYAVLEYPFSFWQYGWDCSKVPNENATLENHVDYLLEVVGLDFFADESMEAYASHYYQSAHQMGYYGYETEDFDGLLKYLPYEPHPHAAFTPNKMEVKFDATLTNKVAKWIAKNGNQMIYINGDLDTWSATAVPSSEGIDAIWYFLKDKHHSSARIKNMTGDERRLLYMKLNEWLGTELIFEK